MHWELWDTESGNLVETFASEADGLRGARDVLAANAPDFAEHLVLGAVHGETGSVATDLPPVLEGDSLIARINEVVASDNAPSIVDELAPVV